MADPAEMTPDEIEQLARSVLALELLDAFYWAHIGGDSAKCDQINDRIGRECPIEVSVLKGGMRIGEVPQPKDLLEYRSYLDHNRDRLARAQRGTSA